MPFTSRLAVMYAGTPGEHSQPNFTLLEPLVYEDRRGNLWTVPATFTTDFASVPRLPIAYLAFGNRGQTIRPAVLHDWLCRFKVVPRPVADKLFLEAMISEGMPEADARSMYMAVSLYTSFIGNTDNVIT